jgi:prepilin-type N-terminal cleavage/methylation domain-containing protein
MTRKAFTLIELLVVIAIIAILAAILFPVFAQAKVAAKKTQAISNFKQIGTATQIYLSDYDDSFPSAYAYNGPANSYWYQYSATFPAGWAAPSTGYLEAEDAHAFANSVQPYSKNYDIHEAPGVKVLPVNLTMQAGRQKKKHGFSMNGFLSLYNATGINLPSQTPLYWQDDANWDGMAWANPYLICNGTGPCRYDSNCNIQTGRSGSFCTDMWTGVESWSYGKGGIVVHADTSAKYYNFGGNVGVTAPQSPTNLRDPYRNRNAQGQGYSPYYCGTYSIECIFRPDRAE